MKNQKGVQYTVSHTIGGITHKSKVWFDGSVYRWVSNDRVPPADTVIAYGIHKLPAYSADAHRNARDADLENFLREAYPEAKPAKKKRTTIKEQATAQIEVASRWIRAAVSHLPTHPMNHAFLWGTIEVTLKNGKTRSYRTCFTSVCAEDLDEAVRIANQCPAVKNVYYNLD